MTDEEIKLKVQELTRPSWWFKSNNWKRMHRYPMLHHQKKAKLKVLNENKVRLFSFMDKVINERVAEAVKKDISSFASINDMHFGDKKIWE